MDRANTLTSDLRKSFTCSVDVIKMGLSQCLYTNMTVQFIQTASVRESSVRIHTHTLSLSPIYTYIISKRKIKLSLSHSVPVLLSLASECRAQLLLMVIFIWFFFVASLLLLLYGAMHNITFHSYSALTYC